MTGQTQNSEQNVEGGWTFTDHGDRRHREFAIMSKTGGVDGGGGRVASVFAGFGSHFSFEEAEKHARLIAAAPKTAQERDELKEIATNNYALYEKQKVINAKLLEALELANSHIKHMAAWISKNNNSYSFEGLGEDHPTIKAAAKGA